MPNTIAQNLQRLVDAKNAIGSAITAKGGTVNSGDGLEEFPADIATIPSGSPAPLSPTRSGATIYDFDGSVIATYTPEEFAALTEYPAHPTHEFLTGDGYNWPLANAKAYSAKYGYVEVGAQYRVTDGKTRLFITLSDGRLNPQLGLGINGRVDVNWGDGSAHNTMTGSNVSTTVYKEHTYAQEGDYIITLTITGSVQFNGDIGYGYILTKSGGDTNTNRVYLNTLQKLYVGNSVTSIRGSAFYNCSSLTSISIPDSVTNIRGNAFYNCFSLTSISIPDGVTEIAYSTFYNCCSLTSVTIPDSVTAIKSYALEYCNSLTSVTIPDSVTSIESNAFYDCHGLGFVKFTPAYPPLVANVNAWSGIPTDCIIYVPQGTLAAYTSATNYPDPAKYTYAEY